MQVKQIRKKRETLQKRKVAGVIVSTLTELNQWCADHAAPETMDLWHTAKMYVLPKDSLDREVEGIVVASKEMLGSIHEAWTTMQQAGFIPTEFNEDTDVLKEVRFSLSVDGMHKLHHGRWVLLPIGMYTIRWDTKRKKWVTSYLPGENYTCCVC